MVMNANITHNEQRRDVALKAGIRKRFVQVSVTLAVQATILFLAAGKLNWMWAWLYVGIYLVGVVINAAFMLRYSPETIAERAETRGKAWDKVIGGLGALMYFVLLLVVAGLDVRFGWTGRIALVLHIAGAVAFVLGGALFSWAMISNAYFSTVVRIQEERGRAVCTTGPYRFVRHPGYVGMIIQSLTLPLMLGSLWALIPGGLTALLMVVRTVLEDRTLHKELDGYRDYARWVRYRLLPGMW
ncbi:MAG: methyltransferase family protein [Anaerolineae bacterium]